MENTEQTQEQLSALLQVRRDKLTELQNDGRDPFKITKFERTHTSAQLIFWARTNTLVSKSLI